MPSAAECKKSCQTSTVCQLFNIKTGTQKPCRPVFPLTKLFRCRRKVLSAFRSVCSEQKPFDGVRPPSDSFFAVPFCQTRPATNCCRSYRKAPEKSCLRRLCKIQKNVFFTDFYFLTELPAKLVSEDFLKFLKLQRPPSPQIIRKKHRLHQIFNHPVGFS